MSPQAFVIDYSYSTMELLLCKKKTETPDMRILLELLHSFPNLKDDPYSCHKMMEYFKECIEVAKEEMLCLTIETGDAPMEMLVTFAAETIELSEQLIDLFRFPECPFACTVGDDIASIHITVPSTAFDDI